MEASMNADLISLDLPAQARNVSSWCFGWLM